MSNRREFLKMMSRLAGAAAIEHVAPAALSSLVLGSQRVLADSAADPQARFVLFRVHGAMDSVLGLHPHLGRVDGISFQDLFLGYSEENELLMNLAGTKLSLGPAAAAVAPFARNMAVVRGIYVGPNDLGHPFALQHMSSGRTQESAPHWTSYLGSSFTKDRSYIVTNAPLQRGTLARVPILPTSVLRSQVARLANNKRQTPLAIYAGSRTGANRYLELLSQRDKFDKFMQVIDETDAEFDQDAYDKAVSEGDANAETTMKQKAMPDESFALASLYSGLARVAQIDLTADDQLISLDTHVRHAEEHLRAQQARWGRIGAFLEKLKKYGLLEHTVVVVITEFNRTPGLNGNGGKDHNYSDNAVAIFGRGVTGGKVIGDRTLFTRADGFPYAYWAGSFVDKETGIVHPTQKQLWDTVSKSAKLPKNVDLIRPHDVWASIINSLAPKLSRHVPEGAHTLPGLFQNVSK